MKLLEILVVVTLIALLGAVGYSAWKHETGIHRGRVFDKQYTPAHIQLMPMNVGKSVILMPIHQPDRYTISIMDGEDTNWFTVDETTYHSMKMGQEVSFD